MSYDAKKLTYQEVTILGKPALFTECRLDRTTVPEGVYRYELRHADEDWGEPVTPVSYTHLTLPTILRV